MTTWGEFSRGTARTYDCGVRSARPRGRVRPKADARDDVVAVRRDVPRGARRRDVCGMSHAGAGRRGVHRTRRSHVERASRRSPNRVGHTWEVPRRRLCVPRGRSHTEGPTPKLPRRRPNRGGPTPRVPRGTCHAEDPTWEVLTGEVTRGRSLADTPRVRRRQFCVPRGRSHAGGSV